MTLKIKERRDLITVHEARIGRLQRDWTKEDTCDLVAEVELYLLKKEKEEAVWLGKERDKGEKT